MFLFFICPQLVQTGQLLDSQCYSLSLEHPDFHETARLPLGELLNSPCYKRSQAPPWRWIFVSVWAANIKQEQKFSQANENIVKRIL